MYIMSIVCVFSIGKNRRLKQAKEEAQAEIEQYRLQREKEFKTKEAAVRIIFLSVYSYQNHLYSYQYFCIYLGEILSKIFQYCALRNASVVWLLAVIMSCCYNFKTSTVLLTPI